MYEYVACGAPTGFIQFARGPFYFATSCEVPLLEADGKYPNAKQNKRT